MIDVYVKKHIIKYIHIYNSVVCQLQGCNICTG